MVVGTSSPPDERRQRILDASLEEFVERGFDGASTNAIAKRAQVAKGLLFHYFESKQGLYVTLLDQAVGQLSELLQQEEQSQPTSSDLIEKMVIWSVRKLRLFRSNPRLYEFVTAAFSKPPDMLRQHIERKRNELEAESWDRFLIGLDTSLLRSDLTIEQAFEITKLFVGGLEAKYMAELAALPDIGLGRLEEMVGELRSYLLVLRDGLYKHEAERCR